MSAKLNDYFTNCLYFTVNSLARTLTKMSDDEFAKIGLSSSQAFLLMLVAENPGISSKEASDVLNLAQSTISRFTDSLVRRGVIEKISLTKGVALHPTEKGLEMQKELHDTWHTLFINYCDILGEEEALKLTKDTLIAGKLLEE